MFIWPNHLGGFFQLFYEICDEFIIMRFLKNIKMWFQIFQLSYSGFNIFEEIWKIKYRFFNFFFCSSRDKIIS